MKPCVIDGIVFHENVNETDADGNVANHNSIVFQMTLLLDIVVHPLEFLLLQGYEVGVIPIMVIGQQSFVGVYGASFLHLS